MKILKKRAQKKRPREDDEDEEEEESSTRSKIGDDDWMIQGRDQVDKAKRRQAIEQKANQRAPELYFKDGETKLLRFRINEPVALWRYRFRSGKRFIAVTQPPRGSKDLCREAGMQASLGICYEVIDKTGYFDKKKGKRIRNIPRFLWVSNKADKLIAKIREKYGDITKQDIEVSRDGSGTDTTYTFMAEEKSPQTPEMIKLPRLMDQFKDYYRPKTVEEMRMLLSGVVPDEEDDTAHRQHRSRRHEDDED